MSSGESVLQTGSTIPFAEGCGVSSASYRLIDAVDIAFSHTKQLPCCSCLPCGLCCRA